MFLHPFLHHDLGSMLRKGLNTCYRFPEYEGVNILWDIY